MKYFLTFIQSKKFILGAAVALAFGIIFILGVNSFIFQTAESLIFQYVRDVPQKEVALVLGARVYPDGRMSDILTDRALTALDLYQKKKVEKILVSGDHGRQQYDEVNTIKDYLLQKGVPASDIFLDHAGFDTYDSVYRAKHIFEVESLVIVTQEFHLPRALYLAGSLGIDAVGVVSDRREYVQGAYNELRETFARVKTFLDVTLQAKPKFLGERIPVTGDSKASWDQL